MAAANEVARVMAEAAAMVQETWKDMAGGLGAWGTVLESWRDMIKWGEKSMKIMRIRNITDGMLKNVWNLAYIKVSRRETLKKTP